VTPLAHAIAADRTLPRRKRRFGDAFDELELLNCQFFDFSQIVPLMVTVIEKFGARTRSGDLSAWPCESLFLPAARCWFEFSGASIGTDKLPPMEGAALDVKYIALLLDVNERGQICIVEHVRLLASGDLLRERLPARFTPGGYLETSCPPSREEHAVALAAMVLACCVLINSPRVVATQQTPPHRGLQRTLTSMGVLGDGVRLREWTTVLLDVGPPPLGAESAEDRPRFLGARALHFCRRYLRVRLGRLEVVSPHWRGDPTLGTVRKSYRVGDNTIRAQSVNE
jgi:hypothetical protein